MLKIAICDDDPVQLAHAAVMVEQELVSYTPEITTFLSSDAFISKITNGHFTPDIALLDIELGGKNGVEFASSLNHLLPSCRIIFLTAYPEYASDVYKVDHIWFVVKNRAEEYLGPALHKAAEAGNAPQPLRGITLRGRGSITFLPLDKILYLSREGRKSLIVTEKERHWSSRPPMSLIGDEIASFFVHCHQGYWVNIKKIASLERESFTLINGEKVPISRTCREEARARFFSLYHL